MRARSSGSRIRATCSSSGSAGECRVRRPAVQRVEGLEPEQQSDRPARDLGSHRHVVVDGLTGEVEHSLPLVGVEVVLHERERHRPLGLRRAGASSPSPSRAPTGPRPGCPAGASSKTPRPTSPSARAEREQLVLGGERAGHGLAVDRAVRDRARGREADAPRRRCASRTMRAISAMSSAVAGSLRAPRSPITYARTAPCGTCAPTSSASFGARRARRGTRGRSPSPSGCPRTARRPGCPRRPPSGR